MKRVMICTQNIQPAKHDTWTICLQPLTQYNLAGAFHCVLKENAVCTSRAEVRRTQR